MFDEDVIYLLILFGGLLFIIFFLSMMDISDHFMNLMGTK